MELLLFILIASFAFVAGIIPVVGVVYGIGITALSEFLGATETELIVIFIVLVVGSIIGLVIGYAVEIGSLGFIWFWSRGCFSNMTSSLGLLAAVIFGLVTGVLVTGSVLALGIVAFKKGDAHLPKKCTSIFGREICVGSE